MLNRRELLQRDPPVSWRRILSELRQLGWGTAEICFVLNVTRGTLWHWENDEEPNPGYEDGRALLKLHALETRVILSLRVTAIQTPTTSLAL